MKTNSRPRLYNASVTWAGNNSEEIFEWTSMIDIDFFLSNNIIQYNFKTDNLISVLSRFGGLMSTFMIIFTVFGNIINHRLLLAKIIETLYYVDLRGMGIKKLKKRRSSKG